MNRKFWLSFAGLIAFAFNSVGQEKFDKPAYLETYLGGAGVFYLAPTLLFQDAKLLVPNSTILQTDLSRFTRTIGFPGYENQLDDISYNPVSSSALGGFIFEAQIGTYQFGKAENRKRNPQLRMGFGYGSVQSVGSYWYNEVITPSDTFVSSSGKSIYTDSVFYEAINVTYSSSQFRINADVLFHSNPDRRFSLFIGMGAQVGATFNNQTQVYYESQSFVTSGSDEDKEILEYGTETVLTPKISMK